MKLITQGRYEVTGRGTLFGLSLTENGIERTSKASSEALMGKIVEIEGNLWEVRGVERQAQMDTLIADRVGILVRPYKEL